LRLVLGLQPQQQLPQSIRHWNGAILVVLRSCLTTGDGDAIAVKTYV
jgi:hypothetical protein